MAEPSLESLESLLQLLLSRKQREDYRGAYLANQVPTSPVYSLWMEALKTGADPVALEQMLRSTGAPLPKPKLPELGGARVPTLAKGALGIGAALGLGKLVRDRTDEESLLGQLARRIL